MLIFRTTSPILAMVLVAPLLLATASPVSARQGDAAAPASLIAEAQEEWIDPIITGGTNSDTELKTLEDKAPKLRKCGDRG